MSILARNHTFPRRLAAALVLALVATVAAPALFAQEDGQGAKAPSVVNVNTASAAQLALLPRVGPAVAERILEYREDNGEFAATEDLMLVRGIGEKTWELLEPWVVTSGDTTLDRKGKVSEAQDRLEAGSGG
jgi:competence protein ComEA